jgi:hypothetical protein
MRGKLKAKQPIVPDLVYKSVKVSKVVYFVLWTSTENFPVSSK